MNLLNFTWLKKIRQEQLTNIKLGRFDSRVRFFTRERSNLDYHALDLSLPIFLEKDKDVLEMRFKLCKAKM